MHNKPINKNKPYFDNKDNLPNKNNTLIILDWDNTLFPTSWFMQNNISKQINNNIDYFIKLDNVLYNFFKKIRHCGKVIVITNALIEWINSSSNVLPKTKDMLQKIKVISARGSYQDQYPNVMEWKKMAFKAEVTHNNINIISVGDAYYEYNALVGLYDTQNNVLLKSIKFVDDPDNDTLVDQIEVLQKVIPSICNLTKHLDLQFKLKDNVKIKQKNI